jgi:hypothetical protein
MGLLPGWEVAGLSNSEGGTTMFRHYREERERMRPNTIIIFHTSLALLQSTLTARTSIRVGNRRVASQCCSPTGSYYGTRGMAGSSWVVVDPEVRRITLGGNA